MRDQGAPRARAAQKVQQSHDRPAGLRPADSAAWLAGAPIGCCLSSQYSLSYYSCARRPNRFRAGFLGSIASRIMKS
jgi:hypothetical protein